MVARTPVFKIAYLQFKICETESDIKSKWLVEYTMIKNLKNAQPMDAVSEQ